MYRNDYPIHEITRDARRVGRLEGAACALLLAALIAALL